MLLKRLQNKYKFIIHNRLDRKILFMGLFYILERGNKLKLY